MEIVFDRLEKFEEFMLVAKLTDEKVQISKNFYVNRSVPGKCFSMCMNSTKDIYSINLRISYLQQMLSEEEFLNDCTLIIYCDYKPSITKIKKMYYYYF